MAIDKRILNRFLFWQSPDLTMKLKSCFERVFGKGGYQHPMFRIRKNINSLNFDYPFPNAERLEKEERWNLLAYFYVKWLLIVLTGVLVGLIFCAATLVIEELTLLKIEIFTKKILPSVGNIGIELYVLFCVCCHIISALPVLFWHPEAQGVGVPETVSYLNGVDVPNFEKWSSIQARLISVTFMVLGGFPGGQTEALIPIGTILAATLCLAKIGNFRFFPNHRYDGDRRDFGAVGLGAAASVTFGTPIGGAFFALQQLSTWHAGITFMIIIGSLTSSYVFILVYDSLRNVDRTYSHVNSLFAPFVDAAFYDFRLNELPTFILMAVIGGILGPLWISTHVQISRFRHKCLSKKWLALIDVIVVGLVISQLWALLFQFYEQHCSIKRTNTKFGEILLNTLEVKDCNHQFFDTTSLFMLSNPENLVKTVLLLPADGMKIGLTVITFLLTFFVSALHLGSPTTSGIVVPNLVMGALWGRIFEHVMAGLLYSEKECRITEYAYLGAVAQVAGVTQYALAFGVMMVETVGVINFAIPVFLVIFVARYVSQMFVSGAYDVLCYQKGYAVINEDSIPLCSDLTARDVMSERVVCLPLQANASVVKTLLHAHQHLEFPVLATNTVIDAASGEPLGECKGVILRKQLLSLLQVQRRESILLQQSLSAIKIESKVLPDGAVIEISRYMNVQPFFVHQDMPLTRVYSLFETLNLHTLLVVDGHMHLVGVITRKDFAGIMVVDRIFDSKIVMRPF